MRILIGTNEGCFGELKYSTKIYITSTLYRFLFKKSSFLSPANRLDHLFDPMDYSGIIVNGKLLNTRILIIIIVNFLLILSSFFFFLLTIYLAGSENCFYWKIFKPLIVLDLEDLNSTNEFSKELKYLSCKWRQTVAYLDASGNWKQVNLSANAFEVLPKSGQQQTRYPSIKVQVSYLLFHCRFYLFIS